MIDERGRRRALFGIKMGSTQIPNVKRVIALHFFVGMVPPLDRCILDTYYVSLFMSKAGSIF